MNRKYFSPALRQGLTLRACSAVLCLAGALLATHSAVGAIIPLSDGNTDVTIDNDGVPAGVIQWDLDDIPQILQEWFWLRVGDGPGSAESPIDSLGLDFENSVDVDGEDDNEFLFARYVDPINGIQVEVQLILTGGVPGSGVSNLSEQVSITNIGASNLDLHLFMYSDFNLSNTAGDDSTTILGAGNNQVRQFDATTEMETVTTPLPSHVQTSSSSIILDSLNDNAPTTLDDSTSLASTDVTWALQWDFMLGPDKTFILSAQKNFIVVPEPSAVVLAGVGLMGLLGMARRRRRRMRH